MNKLVIILALLSVCLLPASADSTKTVASVAELNKAIRSAQPGDTLILQNGTYTDEKITLHANGSTDRPIVVQAETAGKVFFEGNSQMRIGGEYIEVHGLIFRNGYYANVWEFRSKTGSYANNCRITNCEINNYNGPDDKAKSRWVLLYGKNNRIDHCSFINKINEGVLMAVVLEENKQDETSRLACTENKHRIEYNYFGKRPNLKYVDNGGEIIRIGDSYTSLLSSQTIVENNFFEHCDGEVEIISVKSCDNMLRGNYFFESAGALVLRHGNRNRVENNVFVGNNKKNSAGIRVINAGHIIKNNYMEGLCGKGSYSAFSIMNALEEPKANEYHQVKDVIIEGNIFVNCENISFNLRHGNPTRAAVQTKTPEKVIFKSNFIYNDGKEIKFNFLDGMEGIKGILFEDNRINKYSQKDLPKGFIVVDKMEKRQSPFMEFEHMEEYKVRKMIVTGMKKSEK